jgi:ABC-2 type transport system permease protein
VSAIYTVLRKELIELFGERHSLRGPLLQATALFLLVGVVVPWGDRSVWASATGPIVLFQLFPAVIAAMIAADAFAGERERRTLETLLATPIPAVAIFLGKTLSAVAFAVAVALCSLGSALILASRHFGAAAVENADILGIVIGACAASLVTSSLAVAISSSAQNARSAQQMSSMAAIMFTAVSVAVLGGLKDPTASLLLGIHLSEIAAAVCLLLFSARRFRRDRLFED